MCFCARSTSLRACSAAAFFFAASASSLAFSLCSAVCCVACVDVAVLVVVCVDVPWAKAAEPAKAKAARVNAMRAVVFMA